MVREERIAAVKVSGQSSSPRVRGESYALFSWIFQTAKKRRDGDQCKLLYLYRRFIFYLYPRCAWPTLFSFPWVSFGSPPRDRFVPTRRDGLSPVVIHRRLLLARNRTDQTARGNQNPFSRMDECIRTDGRTTWRRKECGRVGNEEDVYLTTEEGGWKRTETENETFARTRVIRTRRIERIRKAN